MQCGECRFWSQGEVTADQGVGHCHRFPPVAMAAWPDVVSARANSAAWAFPVTLPGAWCGEFLPRPGQAAD